MRLWTLRSTFPSSPIAARRSLNFIRFFPLPETDEIQTKPAVIVCTPIRGIQRAWSTPFPGSSLFLPRESNFLEVGRERTLGTRLKAWFGPGHILASLVMYI